MHLKQIPTLPKTKKSSPDQVETTVSDLIHLYAVADRCDVPALRIEVIDELISFYNDNCLIVPSYDHVIDAYGYLTARVTCPQPLC